MNRTISVALIKQIGRLHALIAIVLVSIVLSTVLALSASRISVSFESNVEIAYKPEYIIYEEGSTYYAQAANGNIAFSSTNAATVINSAFANLTSGRTYQQTVDLEGNFTVGSPLFVPSFTQVILNGSIYLASGSDCPIFINANIFTTGADRFITLEGGSLYGNSANQGPSGPYVKDLICFGGACDSEITNMQISDSYDNGISLDGGCNRTKIIDCRFNDCSQTPTNGAIYLGFGYGYEEYNVVQDCIINGSGQNGIYWSEAPYGLISDNNITYWSRVAAGAGISIRGSNSIVTGNQISNGIGSTYGGIADAPSGSSSGPAYNVTVSNNTIYSSGGNGITVFGNKWLITGNTIYNCPRRGIQLCGECKAAIEDNYIRNCVGYGIAIYQSSFNNIVSNNITGGYNDGIEMWDSGTPCLNNTILDNSITNNSGYGIYEADLSNYSRIIGNILTTNALGALSLSGTYDTVENNVGS